MCWNNNNQVRSVLIDLAVLLVEPPALLVEPTDLLVELARLLGESPLYSRPVCS